VRLHFTSGTCRTTEWAKANDLYMSDLSTMVPYQLLTTHPPRGDKEQKKLSWSVVAFRVGAKSSNRLALGINSGRRTINKSAGFDRLSRCYSRETSPSNLFYKNIILRVINWCRCVDTRRTKLSGADNAPAPRWRSPRPPHSTSPAHHTRASALSLSEPAEFFEIQ
jgi:hypothetical protein